VLTTNLVGSSREDADDADALRRQIGARTVSRIYEMCGDPLPLFGTDHRTELRLPEPDEDDAPTAAMPGSDAFDDFIWEEEDRPRYGRPRAAPPQPLD
jgi:DNA replication protein DnaC